jgi:aspartyl protease family protein
MDADSIAQLAYLGLLAVAVGGWFIAQNRDSMGKVAQQAAVWGLIFVGVIAAAGLWNDISRDVMPRQGVVEGGRIEVPVGQGGHYHLTLQVNGVPVDFIVDTGASQIVLSRADAVRAGIDPASLTYLGSAQTANGIVRTASVRLDSLTLGPLTDTGVPAVVNEGDMETSLLGMTYLSRFSRIEIEGGRLILSP